MDYPKKARTGPFPNVKKKTKTSRRIPRNGIREPFSFFFCIQKAFSAMDEVKKRGQLEAVVIGFH